MVTACGQGMVTCSGARMWVESSSWRSVLAVPGGRSVLESMKRTGSCVGVSVMMSGHIARRRTYDVLKRRKNVGGSNVTRMNDDGRKRSGGERGKRNGGSKKMMSGGEKPNGAPEMSRSGGRSGKRTTGRSGRRNEMMNGGGRSKRTKGEGKKRKNDVEVMKNRGGRKKRSA